MRKSFSMMIGIGLAGALLAGCGGDDEGGELVGKPSRPNPFSGYERQMRFAKDWYRMSHHNRAIVIGHWSHAAGFTKAQSNALIWCWKSMAEADDAATRPFAEARRTCLEQARAKPRS